jgi:hypothetical protein
MAENFHKLSLYERMVKLYKTVGPIENFDLAIGQRKLDMKNNWQKV